MTDPRVNEFVTKAKAAAGDLRQTAEELAHKVSDAVPADIKTKAGELKTKVEQAIPDDVKSKAEDALAKLRTKVEDLFPGDKDGNGH